jgi:hypothetical protein
MTDKAHAHSLLTVLLPIALGAIGCTREEKLEESTFYSRRIGPLLVGSCAKSPTGSGCHVVADDKGNALGNLSVETYDDVRLRHDLLVDYGPYGVAGLLLKVVPDFQLSLTSYDSTIPTLITTDILHGGEKLIDFATPGYTAVERWLRDGATENNAPQAPYRPTPGACAGVLGSDEGFDPAVAPATPDYGVFQGGVGKMLGERCAGGNCHGSPANSLYLTCGDSEEQLRWNYFAVADYVSRDPESSEILRRVLDPAAGGTYHEGGAIFESSDDPEYQRLLAWAVARGGPLSAPTEPGFQFFASRVQPMLVKRGCMMLGCHSAAMFHDYRLRGGSGGHFGLPATRKNYELSLAQLALESPDPNTSRLVKKNLPVQLGGILHRGGPLLAGHTSPAECDLIAAASGPLDAQAPYCVLAAWIAQERADRMATLAPLRAIVYVRRSPKPGLDAPQNFADFSPGSEVVQLAVTSGTNGQLTPGAESSLSAQCGLSSASSEVRRPAVSWDGQRIAFAARTSANEPFRIYVSEGGSCAVDSAIDAAPVADGGSWTSNGALVHNFDPAFEPDGRIVFVSTRGNVTNSSAFSYQGPQRTPADPAKWNANLYVRESDGSIRQLTFLLNQELLPSFMRDGRVILTTEKRAPNFYQLAGRRMNLDGGDYHPLFAQRSSIGFNQFTDAVELADRNFAAILSDRGARGGAGTLAIINRSLGIDQRSADPTDFPVDPSAIQFPVPGYYQHSLTIVNEEATGKLAGTRGAYATPSPLPDGRVLVSYSANATDLTAPAHFDIAVVDPRVSGPASTTPLVTGTLDALWPVGVYARQNLGVFRSRLDEPNGATGVGSTSADRAEITFIDVPVLATLLFQNTRNGRNFLDGRATLELWESLPPEPSVTSFDGSSPFFGQDQFGPLYVRRARLGSVTTFHDGSAKVALPGGMPFLLATAAKLGEDAEPAFHFQREEMQVYPGEQLRQSFKRQLFNGMCGGCHGSILGQENHVAVNPDILTRASEVEARTARATEMMVPGAPQGPEFR